MDKARPDLMKAFQELLESGRIKLLPIQQTMLQELKKFDSKDQQRAMLLKFRQPRTYYPPGLLGGYDY